MTVFLFPLVLLTVASEYKTSEWVRREKLLALSASVEAENSSERLYIVPVEMLITPLVISEIHCLVLAMDTL